MMRIKNWKWQMVVIAPAIVFFSCASQPSAIKPYDQARERPSSPAASMQDGREAPSGKLDQKPGETARASRPRIGSSTKALAAQSPGGDSRKRQTVSARPANRDYRKQVIRTKWKKQSPGQSGVREGGEDLVELNFDNADVNEVIAAIASLTGIKYMVDPGIEGSVTIHTAGGISKENLLSVFYLVLEANGLTAVKDGAFYRITTIEGASRLPLRLRLQTEGKPPVRQEEIVTQIIPLHYITAAEMSQVLKPFLSANGTIISHEGSNTLLVVDTGINIMKAVKLVEAFDITIFEKTNHRFFFLKNAEAEDVVNILTEAFAPALNGRNKGVTFIPIKRLNSFLALSSDARMFAKIEQFLLNLDAATQNIAPRIYVYFVKNGSAINLSKLLNQVFAEAVKTGTGDNAQPPLSPAVPELRRVERTNPLVRNTKREITIPAASSPTLPTAPAGVTDASASGTGSNSLKGVVKITPDEIRNALVIEATPADYRVIMRVLEQIDVLPRQVLIEATIAEIDYDLITDLGVSWQFQKDAAFGDGLQSLTSNGATGLTFAFGIDDELRATLSALERQNKVNILSSPHVLASDNQEARIEVSNEIPIVSAETVVPTSGESIVTTTVQYRDTGVLLSVTPHINDRRLVTMDIYQEVSEQTADVVVAGDAFPSFFKRVVQTSLTVQHGQTIVLGGLIRENKSESDAGVPWLARMPLIGWLFGSTRDSFDKTELIILLTPTVIVSSSDVDAVTEGFRLKVDSVIKDMYDQQTVLQ